MATSRLRAKLLHVHTCYLFVASPLGGSFIPFNTNAPIQIVDTNPALNEVVTPTSVMVSGSSCTIHVNPVNQHYSFTLRSGTFGLQEAINAAGGAIATTVVVTPSFTAAGGQTSTITNAKGSTAVSILDARTATLCSYTWNGTNYAQAACMGSGGGGFTAGGDLSGSSTVQTVIGINGVTLSGLTTGLLKITTVTGAPSIAAPGADYADAFRKHHRYIWRVIWNAESELRLCGTERVCRHGRIQTLGWFGSSPGDDECIRCRQMRWDDDHLHSWGDQFNLFRQLQCSDGGRDKHRNRRRD